MSSNLPSKILIVDNDQGAINSVVQLLQPYNINILKAADWESALYQFNNNRFDLCIVALKLENLPGTALIQKWRFHEVENKRHTAFILATHNQKTAADEALIKELGEIVTIPKPFKLALLLSAMASAMKARLNRLLLEKIEAEAIAPYLGKGDYEGAIALAKSKLEPLGEKGYFRSALIHEKAKKVDTTIQMLGKLSSENPQNMLYLNELGRIHLQLGQIEKARNSYEKADKIAPMNIDRVRELANLYLTMKEPEQSIEKFKELITLTPERPETKFEAYNAVFEAGFAKHAREFCDQTSTPQELVRHFNNKGVMLAKEGKFEEAVKEYQHAANLIPGNKELYRILYNMAISYINTKSRPNIEKAHALLIESLKLQPDYDKAKEKLALTAKYLKKP